MADMTGVVFPQTEGRRSTSAVGREIVAGALGGVDPVGSAAARRETAWRKEYAVHFRRLVEVGMEDRDAALTVARQGLEALHGQMRWVGASGVDQPLQAGLDEVGTPLHSATVDGTAEPERELTLPYRGRRLRGDELRRRLDQWVRDGVVEPGVQQAVERVLDHPEWLDLRDQRVVVLGAGAEMGPLRSILRWGGEVVGIDLPRPDLWRRVLTAAREGAGRLVIPTPDPEASDARLAERAGADLLHDLGAVGRWIDGLEGRLVLGNYVYADGATNVRVTTAVDALTTHLTARRDDLALGFLATPTDSFVVPADAVAQATRNYGERSLGRLVRTPLRVGSGGRLLRRQYAPGEQLAISDSIVEQQGPNYLLAKRVHRWRASVAADDGHVVSMNVAPPTRTRSVTKNRALAAAYAGAHFFGIEVFEPATSNTLMAALLVDDLRRGEATRGGVGAGDATDPRGPRDLLLPWQAEARAAAHGGLWRVAYDPRSALGIAALLGLGGARQ